jgi:hypothetical protein
MSLAPKSYQTTAQGTDLPTQGSRTPSRRTRWHLLAATIIAAVVLLGLVPFLFDHWWYPAHYLTDLPNDYRYAHAAVSGEAPYRSFFPEYPPLSLWLIVPPALPLRGPTVDFRQYQVRFATEMFVLAALSAALVVLTAWRLWPGTLRPYLAATLFVVFVLAIGPLVEDRFDIGVALFSALVLLAMVHRRLAVAAIVVGLGCAYKITPIVLLPLLVSVVGWSRRIVLVCGLCLAAVFVGFLPYLFTATHGIRHMFLYQTHRPLELESVLGLPVIVGHLLSGAPLQTGISHRSWYLVGPHSATMTSLSTPLMILALVAVSALLWRRRDILRDQPRTLALGALALYLAFLCTDRVLSPQYLIWVIPVAVLVLLDDPLLGLAALATATLTQLEFPVLWHGILEFRTADLIWLCVRNLSLVATFALALWRLWRLPAATIAPAGALATMGARPGRSSRPPSESDYPAAPAGLSAVRVRQV